MVKGRPRSFAGTLAAPAKMIATSTAPTRSAMSLTAPIDALSPLKVLDRGYAVVINQSNSRAVLDAATVKFDDELDIRLAKGRLRARATGRSL